MQKPQKSPSLWIVTEGLAGTENQCIGIAEALADLHEDFNPPVLFRTRLREPWKTFSPYLPFEQWWSFDPPFYPPWPDILITGGRKSIAAARYIKRLSNNKTFCLYVQDPRYEADFFDLIAVPAHDRLRGENVVVTTGAPNRITPENLAQAKKDFPNFESLQKPRVAVLVGGNSKTHNLTKAAADKIIEGLKKAGKKASLMITTSRRTPAYMQKLLEENFHSPAHFIWNGNDNNPYFGLLAWADFILVTNDSASMMSEAATTGKPVYILELEGSSGKFEKFYAGLENIGAVRKFTGTLQPWTYEPLQDAQKVAQILAERYERFITLEDKQ